MQVILRFIFTSEVHISSLSAARGILHNRPGHASVRLVGLLYVASPVKAEGKQDWERTIKRPGPRNENPTYLFLYSLKTSKLKR